MLPDLPPTEHHRVLLQRMRAALASPVEEIWKDALEELRDMGDDASWVLQELVRDEVRRKRRVRLGLGLVILTWVAGLIVLGLGTPTIVFPLWFAAASTFFAVTGLAREMQRKPIALLLAERTDQQSHGLMLDISSHDGLPAPFIEALTRALRQAKPDQSIALSPSSRAVLRSILRRDDPTLVIAALHAIEQIGTEEDLSALVPVYNGYARASADGDVRDAARRAALAIEARAARARAGEGLLRPSEAPDEDLLRPVAGTSPAQEALLLRAETTAEG